MSEEEADGFSVGEALGAEEITSSDAVTLYIPSQDRDGAAFNPAPWIEEALSVLARIGGGATAYPNAQGAWLNTETGALIREDIVIVYTYIDADLFRANIAGLRDDLHRLGRATNQGEVVCGFGDLLYKIRRYD